MDDTLPLLTVEVLIAGGGPCGLMLAIELGRRGVPLLLVDEDEGTAVHPQANATQARTMEHYRRLGFADEIRALGLPLDAATDIAYCTRYAGHELARIRLPSAREARTLARRLGGSWSAAELPHSVAQKFVERVLLRVDETAQVDHAPAKPAEFAALLGEALREDGVLDLAELSVEIGNEPRERALIEPEQRQQEVERPTGAARSCRMRGDPETGAGSGSRGRPASAPGS